MQVELAPDHGELIVDGENFDVSYDVSQPGAYHLTWLTGPNPGYGFTTRATSHTRMARQQLIDQIRGFLQQIDPGTGYIED